MYTVYSLLCSSVGVHCLLIVVFICGCTQHCLLIVVFICGCTLFTHCCVHLWVYIVYSLLCSSVGVNCLLIVVFICGCTLFTHCCVHLWVYTVYSLMCSSVVWYRALILFKFKFKGTGVCCLHPHRCCMFFWDNDFVISTIRFIYSWPHGTSNSSSSNFIPNRIQAMKHRIHE